jgi:hypothetical protein
MSDQGSHSIDGSGSVPEAPQAGRRKLAAPRSLAPFAHPMGQALSIFATMACSSRSSALVIAILWRANSSMSRPSTTS